jgi:hypothetical protein
MIVAKMLANDESGLFHSRQARWLGWPEPWETRQTARNEKGMPSLKQSLDELDAGSLWH